MVMQGRTPTNISMKWMNVTVRAFVMLGIYFVSMKYVFVSIKLVCVCVKFLKI
jgi:hypothetical protein